MVCVICRIPEDIVRSWADSFEKVMSSEGKTRTLYLQSDFSFAVVPTYKMDFSGALD